MVSSVAGRLDVSAPAAGPTPPARLTSATRILPALMSPIMRMMGEVNALRMTRSIIGAILCLGPLRNKLCALDFYFQNVLSWPGRWTEFRFTASPAARVLLGWRRGGEKL